MKTLTPDDVVQAMPRCGPWRNSRIGDIRNDDDECPGCAALRVLYGEHGYKTSPEEAATFLGVKLEQADAIAIISAADRLRNHATHLRARMMVAGGLT